MAEQKISNEKVMSVIAYLFGPISGIAILLLEKKNEFIRFHAMQSTLVFGGYLLLLIVLNIIPILGTILAFVISIFTWPIWLVLALFLMYKAYSGEKYKLPYFGALAEKQLAKLK